MKFFKTIYDAYKLNRDIRSEVKELAKSTKDKDFSEKESISLFNKLVFTALLKVENSELSTEHKNIFKKSFLSGMFKMALDEYPDLSFKELQKKFKWEDELFKEMVEANVKKDGLKM